MYFHVSVCNQKVGLLDHWFLVQLFPGPTAYVIFQDTKVVHCF